MFHYVEVNDAWPYNFLHVLGVPRLPLPNEVENSWQWLLVTGEKQVSQFIPILDGWKEMPLHQLISQVLKNHLQ